MNQSKGTIYFRDNAWYRMEKVIKMGISSLVKSRSNTYITGEVERGEYIHIIEIPLEKMQILDKCLKSYFKSYHIYKGGGTEFYNRCIIDLIEPYLQQINIEYTFYTKEEIHLINRCDRVRNIPNVDNVKNMFNKLNVKDIIQKYKDKKSRFYCKDCHCFFSKKQSYECHLISNKHKMRISNDKIKLHKCICKKSFAHLSGLYRHRCKCKCKENENDVSKIDKLETEIQELRQKIEHLENTNTNCAENENLDYITDKVILQCMNKIYGSIPFPDNPENHLSSHNIKNIFLLREEEGRSVIDR